MFGEVQPGQQDAIVSLECDNNSSTGYLNSLAVYSACNNGGGTADRALLYGLVV